MNRGVNRERRESLEIPGVTNVAEREARESRDPRCDERRRESLEIPGVTNVAEREARESRDPRCDERHRERGERVSRSQV